MYVYIYVYIYILTFTSRLADGMAPMKIPHAMSKVLFTQLVSDECRFQAIVSAWFRRFFGLEHVKSPHRLFYNFMKMFFYINKWFMVGLVEVVLETSEGFWAITLRYFKGFWQIFRDDSKISQWFLAHLWRFSDLPMMTTVFFDSMIVRNITATLKVQDPTTHRFIPRFWHPTWRHPRCPPQVGEKNTLPISRWVYGNMTHLQFFVVYKIGGFHSHGDTP